MVLVLSLPVGWLLFGERRRLAGFGLPLELLGVSFLFSGALLVLLRGGPALRAAGVDGAFDDFGQKQDSDKVKMGVTMMRGDTLPKFRSKSKLREESRSSSSRSNRTKPK